MTSTPERPNAMRGRLLAGLVLCALAACSGTSFAASAEAAEDLFLPAILIRVVDGDTLKVAIDSGPITIRMHGIDAPERNQANGAAATKLMRALVEGEALELVPVEQDKYDRMVAKVYVRGEDIGARMISGGYAWAYREHLRREPADQDYCRLEAEARDAGRGLWAAAPDSPQPPWEFRARNRDKQGPATDYSQETAGKCLAAIGQAAREPATAGSNPACPIKGNINSKGERIYHVPGSPSYNATRIDTANGERWFCSAGEARAAGWREPRGSR